MNWTRSKEVMRKRRKQAEGWKIGERREHGKEKEKKKRQWQKDDRTGERGMEKQKGEDKWWRRGEEGWIENDMWKDRKEK